jgi:hypothetical protein
MKVYFFKHNGKISIESFSQKDMLAEAYHELFAELLHSGNISDKKIYESFNISKNKITSAPHNVKALLKKDKLPAFKFLICKN